MKTISFLVEQFGVWRCRRAAAILERAEEKRKAAAEAAALKPGTRVRITGACCALGKRHVGEIARILRFIEDAGDYAVHLENEKHEISRDGRWCSCGYLCENGFEVLPP